MNKRIIIILLSFNLYQCSNFDVKSDSDNILLLNEILKDTKLQVPYTYNSFYTMDKGGYLMDKISKPEQEFIINQDKKANKQYRFKPGDIQFYDTLSQQIKPSIFIHTDEESYNKEVISISRPYELNENEVIIFFFETFLYYRNNHPGPAVGGTWAIRFKRIDNKWVQINFYPGVDLT